MKPAEVNQSSYSHAAFKEKSNGLLVTVSFFDQIDYLSMHPKLACRPPWVGYLTQASWIRLSVIHHPTRSVRKHCARIVQKCAHGQFHIVDSKYLFIPPTDLLYKLY